MIKNNNNNLIENNSLLYKSFNNNTLYNTIKISKNRFTRKVKPLIIVLNFLFIFLFNQYKFIKAIKFYINRINNYYDIPILKNLKKLAYIKTNYSTNNIRYNFKELFYKRKIFNINYSYLPYENINKSFSYDDNANNIYISSGMLNITKLDYYYYDIIYLKNSNLNHIHLAMSFDKNYILLSSISIASILNTSNIYTYIHFHLILIF